MKKHEDGLKQKALHDKKTASAHLSPEEIRKKLRSFDMDDLSLESVGLKQAVGAGSDDFLGERLASNDPGLPSTPGQGVCRVPAMVFDMSFVEDEGCEEA